MINHVFGRDEDGFAGRRVGLLKLFDFLLFVRVDPDSAITEFS